jgi:low temperature requirement protein LtrA
LNLAIDWAYSRLVHVRSVDGEKRVTPLELFLDIVFVFAITKVTGFLAANETGEGLLRGALLLAALWWAWRTYAWLTNTVDPDALEWIWTDLTRPENDESSASLAEIDPLRSRIGNRERAR